MRLVPKVCALVLLGACDERIAPRVDDGGVRDVVPVIEGQPWTVAIDPDLGPFASPEQQVVDFGVWQARDGTFQLVSCVRQTSETGEGRLLHRWEGDRVEQTNWPSRGVFLRADPSLGETAGGLQAPYVVDDGTTFRMFYGDWEHIALATSADGKVFSRARSPGGTPALFDEGIGANTRDPMVFSEGGQHRVFYTAHPGGAGAVYVRTTNDWVSYGPSRIVARGGTAGSGPFSAECPQVVFHEPTRRYFLFRTQHYGEGAQTLVYRSASLDDFGIDDDTKLVASLPIAAPEWLLTPHGEFLFFLRSDLKGVVAARLRWEPRDARRP